MSALLQPYRALLIAQGHDEAVRIIDEQAEALAIATALVRKWSNFDFDCPDEYNAATDEDEDDGWALDQLYEETAK